MYLKIDGLEASTDLQKNSIAVNTAFSLSGKRSNDKGNAKDNNSGKNSRDDKDRPKDDKWHIEDIVLESGESIFEDKAVTAIKANYQEDKEIYLTLKGDFKTNPKIKMDKMLFTYEPGLLHQSILGNEPPVRVYLIEVLNDEDGKPVNLKLTGKNFMLFYKFSFSLIDGEFGFGHSTNVLNDGVWETIVHIPDPKKFSQNTEHSISYSTPFGTEFKRF